MAKGRGTIAVALLGCVLAAHGAGIYKWIDAQGRVHYGERPPEGGGAREMTVEKGGAPDPAVRERAARQRKLLNALEEERALRRQQEEEASRKDADRKRRCITARDRLRSYREAGVLYDLDRDGRRRILSDGERSAALDKAEGDVRRWCD